MSQDNSQKGVSLYFSFMVMVLLLSIALGLTTIFLTQTKIIRDIGYSVVAFYAADTGLEQELSEKNFLSKPAGSFYSNFLDLDNDGGGLQGTGNCPNDLIDSNDACYKVMIISSGSVYRVRSVGSYKGTQRAVEINF